MNHAAGFTKRLVFQQGALAALVFAALALFAPALLRLGADIVFDVLGRLFLIAAPFIVAVALLSYFLVQRHRYTLRTLAMGSRAIEPMDVEALRRLPYWIAVGFLALTSLAALVLDIPPVRPPELGGEAGRELAVLGVTIALATAIPGFVLTQSGIGRLFEMAPLDPVTAQLEELEARGIPRKRSRQHLVFAVVVPVVLVGVGGVLTAYAHLRALTEWSRETVAVALARGVVGAGDTRRSLGQTAAMETAKARGYDIDLYDEAPVSTDPAEMSETPSTMEAKVRTGDDRLELFLPVARGNATVAFGSDLDFATTFPFAAVAAVCAIAAAFFGSLLARLISRDLSNATTRLRALGTEEVLRGVHDEPFPARFQVVGKLAEAALALADRFRVFAGAQERALEARENARRMRGLLFASVSHDLKSPLNAILGFADTIDRATLGEAQRESLDLISTRGRELVALIETILDAARVEAGQLALSRDLEKVATVLAVSAKRARELAIEAGELRVEMVGDIPKVDVDLTHLTRALAVVVAHALRAASAETTGGKGEVTVRATLDPKGDRVRIDIDHGPSTISAEELQALLSRQSSSRGKGLTLGLSLARSIFELHGGSIEVAGTPGGGPVVTTYIPTKPRARATRPSVI